ncbi:MAG: VacJ family lipoprotein [Rhodobacteraceae bacterium]|nr:MAG: VacJ family lipoprotein [Paracoccaceae bacterium]
MRRVLFGIACVAGVAGCATPAPEGALIADPWERTNREIHEFNKGLDVVLVRPVSFVYREATPDLFQFLISNFVEHLRLPVIAVNDVLQGEFERGLSTVGRFAVNTLVGAGGLLDPATEFGLPYDPNDGGITLARAGAEEGAFVVLPLLGPTTVRDGFGRLFDFAIDPFNFLRVPGGAAGEVARVAVPVVDVRSRNFELIDEVLYETEDSYVTVRAATVQNLRRRLRDRDLVDPESLPDIFGE